VTSLAPRCVLKQRGQVAEFEFPRPHAEKILAEHGGDVTKALEALVNSPA
jgi:hypothetical protein